MILSEMDVFLKTFIGNSSAKEAMPRAYAEIVEIAKSVGKYPCLECTEEPNARCADCGGTGEVIFIGETQVSGV